MGLVRGLQCDQCKSVGFVADSVSKGVLFEIADADGWRIEDDGRYAICPMCRRDNGEIEETVEPEDV